MYQVERMGLGSESPSIEGALDTFEQDFIPFYEELSAPELLRVVSSKGYERYDQELEGALTSKHNLKSLRIKPTDKIKDFFSQFPDLESLKKDFLATKGFHFSSEEAIDLTKKINESEGEVEFAGDDGFFKSFNIKFSPALKGFNDYQTSASRFFEDIYENYQGEFQDIEISTPSPNVTVVHISNVSQTMEEGITNSGKRERSEFDFIGMMPSLGL